MSTEQPIHVFPYSDATKRVYCGHWYERDGWSILPDQVTCVDCMRRALAMAIGREPDAIPYGDDPAWPRGDS